MRVLTHDYNLFQEAISAYINKGALIRIHETTPDKRLFGYLLLDFEMPRDLNFSNFTIYKSKVIDLEVENSIGQRLKKAFICPVLMPKYVNYHHSHLYTLALSAICSFAFERPVFSTTNDSYNRFKIATPLELKEIGIDFPQKVLGNPESISKPHPEIITLWEKRLRETIKMVDFSIKNESLISYETLIQSFRLIQLGHQNKKNDFDLAFSLLIAGIESISQISVPQIDFIKNHENYKKWKKESRKSESLKELFTEYLKMKEYVVNNIKHRDLTKRFVLFINTFCPSSRWNEALYRDLIVEGLEVREKYPYETALMRDLTPNELKPEEIERVIKQTYQFRSKFLHTGKPTPHARSTNAIHERYFEVIENTERRQKLLDKMTKENRNESPYSEWSKVKDTLIKYELMSAIARISITEYVKGVQNENDTN